MLTRHAEPVTVRSTPRTPIELMLRSLPDEHREVIIATYFQGRTTRDAARMLGLAPTDVTARLCQAMRVLSVMVAIHREEPPGRHCAQTLPSN
jgi:DNA-directed RNA polymerase specialized sigma24 family protein